MANIIDKVAWLYIKNKKVLAVQSVDKNIFSIPGGRRVVTETDEQTLHREIKEELDIYLIPETIRFLGECTIDADNKPAGTQVKLVFYGAEYYGEMKPRFEILKYEWLDSSDFDKLSPANQWLFNEFLKHNLIN